MIIKMIILRILGSSDDKEKENIGIARPEGPPLSIGASDGCQKNRCLSNSASDACRKNRRYDVKCRRESKPSQPIGTG